MYGFVSPLLHIFPYNLVAAAFLEMPHLGAATDVFHSDMYVAARYSNAGVVRYDPERAFNGYTLFSSGNSLAAFLVDMKGQMVHQWHLPYERIRNASTGLEYNEIPEDLLWHGIYLYPNGDLLAVYEGWGTKFYGYGLAKMDRDSRPVWTYMDHVHHDVAVGPDGRIYTLVQNWRTQPIPGLPKVTMPGKEGFVAVLSPEGKLLKKVSILDAFARSRYRGMIRLLHVPVTEDMLHTNSVKPISPALRARFPEAGPNTVLISTRNLDAIELLDLDAEKIIWVLQASWARQHDARPLSDGNIMLFDDLGDFAHGNHSRVVEFEPDPFKIVWEFPGDSGETLDSEILGAEQKLPNGNVLITDSGTARLLEVTPDKKVVWEYRSPFLQGPHHEFVPVLNSAHRYAPGELHFQFNHQTDSNKLQTARLGEGSQ
jgi:hypothetical protein